MALVISSSVQSKPGKLKDYLLDDLGSSSSSGFRSFPRRQCCVAVRNLIDLDLHRCRRSSSSKISRAIRKASTAIASAVKLLPFKSPRSVSRRLGKWRPLKKELAAEEGSRDCEIEWWISNAAAAVEKHQPLDLMSSNETPTESSANADSWSESDSEFTLVCSSFDENGVVRKKGSSSVESKSCRRHRVKGGDESTQTATTKNKWSEEDEKLSPVSVMNFPDDGEERGSSSPVTRRLNNLEGTKEKLMQRLRRFECLSRMNPTSIEGRLSLDDESPIPSFQSSPSPHHALSLREDDETEDVAAERLLSAIKAKPLARNDAYVSNTERLLLSFFREGLVEGREKNRGVLEETLLKEAEEWVGGICDKEKRNAYVKEMEESGVWGSGNGGEKEEAVVQVEEHVLGGLVDEMAEELVGLYRASFDVTF